MLVVPRLRARERPGLPGARGLAMAAIAFGLAACGDAEGDTCEVPTEEISAVALVIDSGWDIRAAIDFEAGDRRGNNSPLALCDTDRLTINGEEPGVFEKADRIEYAISRPADGERSYRFVLERDAEGDVLTFEVELPPPFGITAPLSGAAIDFSQEQVLRWEPALADGVMQVELGEMIGGGECVLATTEGHTYEAAGGVTVDDTGQWTIPAGAVASMTTEDCTLTYTLARVTLAPYPEALEGSGRVEARTERYVDVVVLR
jgi:hypothetical protein